MPLSEALPPPATFSAQLWPCRCTCCHLCSAAFAHRPFAPAGGIPAAIRACTCASCRLLAAGRFAAMLAVGQPSANLVRCAAACGNPLNDQSVVCILQAAGRSAFAACAAKCRLSSAGWQVSGGLRSFTACRVSEHRKRLAVVGVRNLLPQASALNRQCAVLGNTYVCILVYFLCRVGARG